MQNLPHNVETDTISNSVVSTPLRRPPP